MRNIYFLLFGSILLILGGCNNTGRNTNIKLKDKFFIDNQGVAINYTDSKIGDTVLLFIHGWGINQNYWEQQVAHFKRKYRTVTIDLPGFGQSGKNRESWTVENYAKDVSAVLKQLDLKHTILIAHSMSGSIAVEAALTNPARVVGVVGVDNFKYLGTELTPAMEEEWRTFYRAARENFKAVISVDIERNLFSTSTAQAICKRVTTDILNSDPRIAVNSLENADKYPFAEKLKSFSNTLCLINSDITPTDTSAFQRLSVNYYLFSIGATGHYPMLEEPDKFNALLQQAINRMQK